MTSRAGARTGGDGGVTLVETVLTVAVMGTAVVTIVGGLLTSAVGSDYNRDQADAAVVERNLAEALAALPYQACPASYVPAYTPPAGYTATVTAVEYWNTAAGAFTVTCPAADYGFERLTIRVASTDGRDVEQLQVEKRAVQPGEAS